MRGMGGVDMFDQRAAAYHVLRRTKKYWKSIFLDMIDVVGVNKLFALFCLAGTKFCCFGMAKEL